jgi:hypothetical protein
MVIDNYDIKPILKIQGRKLIMKTMLPKNGHKKTFITSHYEKMISKNSHYNQKGCNQF